MAHVRQQRRAILTTRSQAIVFDRSVNTLIGFHTSVRLTPSYGVYNGTASYTNIYSTGLNSFFTPAKFTHIVHAKVSSGSVWTDGNTHTLASLGKTGSANRILLLKPSTNNTLDARYYANSVLVQASFGSVSTTNEFTFVQTVNASADELYGYLDAVASAKQTGLGVWAGSLDATVNVIGAQNTSALLPWIGNIYNYVMGLDVATPAQITTLDTKLKAGTLTSADLDTIFPSGWIRFPIRLGR